MLMLVSVVAMWALVTGFLVWLLIYCLRTGVVGGGNAFSQDAHREEQPFRYWSGIAGLVTGIVGMIGVFIYAMTR